MLCFGVKRTANLLMRSSSRLRSLQSSGTPETVMMPRPEEPNPYIWLLITVGGTFVLSMFSGNIQVTILIKRFWPSTGTFGSKQSGKNKTSRIA